MNSRQRGKHERGSERRSVLLCAVGWTFGLTVSVAVWIALAIWALCQVIQS